MFASARKALGMIFEPAFLGVVFKSFLLTLALFGLMFAAVQYGIQHLPPLHWHWLNIAIGWIASLLVIVALFFLGGPVAALFGSLFLNGVAKRIEAKYYPGDTTTSGAPFLTYLFVGLRLAAEVIVVTLALLPADVMLPGVGSVTTLVANGWLLGREFFELAALRHLSRSEVDNMRKRHPTGILGAGIVIALLAMIPVVNFFAPLFGAAFMVHVFQHYQRQERLA
ncbi:MAG: EI24 domain-containing protein [Rhizomicrobium sp.]|jgi:CysZ protein